MARTGIRPPATDARKAKCCECMAFYADGRYLDCKVRNCPLYPRMNHRKLHPDLSWLFEKWTKHHERKKFELKLTEVQYIAQFIMKDNGKFNIGYPAMFRAKCFDCCANFNDGRLDCEITTCALYYWMPYRELLPDLNWLFDSPYTKRHQDRAKFEKLTHDEYITKYIARASTDDEPEEEEQVTRVRVLAP